MCIRSSTTPRAASCSPTHTFGTAIASTADLSHGWMFSRDPTSGSQSPLLAGVRVLELSQLIAAPLCGLQLLDLGAEVVKVEPPGGEPGRRMPPFAPDGESLWFHALNRGKRGVVVDRADAATVRRLTARPDAVIAHLAGAAPLSYADAAGEQPALVWCRSTGHAVARGGRAAVPSLRAAVGLAAVTGEAEGPPLRVPV